MVLAGGSAARAGQRQGPAGEQLGRSVSEREACENWEMEFRIGARQRPAGQAFFAALRKRKMQIQ